MLDPDLAAMLRLLSDMPEADRLTVIGELGPAATAVLLPLLDELSQEDYSADLARLLEQIGAGDAPAGLTGTAVDVLRELDARGQGRGLEPAAAGALSRPAPAPLRFLRGLVGGR